jgi:hypothetical protein
MPCTFHGVNELKAFTETSIQKSLLSMAHEEPNRKRKEEKQRCFTEKCSGLSVSRKEKNVYKCNGVEFKVKTQLKY